MSILFQALLWAGCLKQGIDEGMTLWSSPSGQGQSIRRSNVSRMNQEVAGAKESEARNGGVGVPQRMLAWSRDLKVKRKIV